MTDRPEASEVRATYDRIAEHFARTRHHPWPEVETFLSGVEGDRGLDVGCGNGRHVEPLADRCSSVVGVDASARLLDVASERTGTLDAPVELVQGDAASLPLTPGSVDVGLYVATVHHLGSRDRRRRSLDELARVLAPGGRALVSTWSTDHDRFDAAEGFDTTVDWTLPGGETVPRYYHIYDPVEFEADLAASDLVAETFVSSGNCFADCRVE
jgi:ubiquinone/menaquinone biosynthesis C-methylase UbiE